MNLPLILDQTLPGWRPCTLCLYWNDWWASIKTCGLIDLDAQEIIVPTCTCSFKVEELLSNSVDDILDGLSRCSHYKFAKNFADICSLKGQPLLGMSDIFSILLEKIKKTYADAFVDFTSLFFLENGMLEMQELKLILFGTVMVIITWLWIVLNPRIQFSTTRIVITWKGEIPCMMFE